MPWIGEKAACISSVSPQSFHADVLNLQVHSWKGANAGVDRGRCKVPQRENICGGLRPSRANVTLMVRVSRLVPRPALLRWSDGSFGVKDSSQALTNLANESAPTGSGLQYSQKRL